MIKQYRYLFLLFVPLLALFSCGEKHSTPAGSPIRMTGDTYNLYDSARHIVPVIDKVVFDTTHSWDFGWVLLGPIDSLSDDKDELALSRRLSPGQKALYFFWYLDDEVCNGGFIQFYWNGYRKYVPAIIDGLKLVNDTTMINLVTEADKELLAHETEFQTQKQKNDWEPLYNTLPRFDDLDSLYFLHHDHTMDLIEHYARQHPAQFVKLK
jgi:hypothetical protein